MTISIGTLGSVMVTAEDDALWLRTANPSQSSLDLESNWPTDALQEAGGRSTAIEIEQLLEQGLAESEGAHVYVPWNSFAEARKQEFRSLFQWTDWSPFLLKIERSSDLGRPDFRYRYHFLAAGREAKVDRAGYFVRRVSHPGVFHLDDQTFALIEAMDRFNQMPSQQRTAREHWITFATVKECATTIGARIDQALQANEVIVPSRVGVEILENPDGGVSFVPRCSGVPTEGLRNAFQVRPEAESVYSVDLGGGKRARVVLDDEQVEIFRRMKRLQGLRGEARESATRNPEQFFDGLLGRIDLSHGYSRRVEGVGRFVFAPVPRREGGPSPFFGSQSDSISIEEPVGPPPVEDERPTRLEWQDADGKEWRIHFRNRAAREEFARQIREALAAGEPSVNFQGVEIAVDEELAESVEESDRRTEGAPGKRNDRYLLIYTDETDLREWDKELISRIACPTSRREEFERPRSLKPDVELKTHQKDGVAWLQHCLRQSGRRGCLLADDMGLGKTLQILTFLAWAIEQGRIDHPNSSTESGPWRPILIVAPVMLLEADTWRREMRNFFRGHGEVFEPVSILHGREVQKCREAERGRETELGRPLLPADRLMANRVVITNYETLKNYQHSFAQTVPMGTLGKKSLWSFLVTDEAHEFKTPNTKISHAIKAIPADFHVACTGTPVENRLLDAWNIFDAIEPALLGTATEFTSRYENRATEADTLSDLRNRILFGAPNAFLVRRDKRSLPDLPEKREVPHFCELSEAEVREHLSLVEGLRKPSRGTSHLRVLQMLSALYQHPSLPDGSWSRKDAATLLEESAKLRSVLAQLRDIRAAGEKALIFVRLVDMQNLLAEVLRSEFRLPTPIKIINGATPRGGQQHTTASSNRAKQSRAAAIDEFRAAAGFHVLILSPFVAGVGLTLTEANHVIHYGRWWNPAVEAQATDRVFRIGQTRPVTVHLPILQDPQGRVRPSFDECLDNLLREKRGLAADFLSPAPGEDSIAEELRAGLAGSDRPDGQQVLGREDIERLAPSQFEALVACLYAQEGCRTILTSVSNDGGADVVAINQHEVVLVQAKHSSRGIPVTDSAIEDLLGAQDIYQPRLDRKLRLHAVTNSTFDAAAKARASRSGIILREGAALLTSVRDARLNLGDVVGQESRRAQSFDDGLRKIRATISAV